MVSCEVCRYPIPGGGRVCGRCTPTLAVLPGVAPMGMLLRDAADGAAPAQPALFGKFHLESVLGQGAMGVVYAATDAFIGRRVALKLARLGDGLSPERLEAVQGFFAQEARAAGQLCHPNIVTIHEAGQVEGFSYIVMEQVEGLPLADLLQQTGALPLSRAVAITRQIARALAYAHERGVVHRDIKPSNVLVEPMDAVKVVDFGLARLLSAAASAERTIAGTPSYMAPEQLTQGQSDTRSDLFSLASVFYECVTGYPPFGADSLQGVLWRLVHDPPRPLPLVDSYQRRAYSAFFQVALNKDPAGRFQSAAAFLRALDKLDALNGRRPAETLCAAAPASEPDLERSPLLRRSVTIRYRPPAARLQPEAPEAPEAPDSVLQGWLRELSDPNPETRRGAIRALVELGAAAARGTPALVTALRDPDPQVRWAAAEALANLGPPAALAVAEALRDVTPHVRVIAAAVLGRIGPGARRAVPALSEAMRDRSPEVRRQAAESLGAIGVEARAAVKTLLCAAEDWVEEVREEALRALRRIGPAAVPALMARLEDADEALFARAAELLLAHEEHALAPLVQALGHSSARVRRRAAEILERIGPRAPSAVDPLTRALQDRDGEVRAAAARALDCALKIF
jgi:serine/threonine protein kinase